MNKRQPLAGTAPPPPMMYSRAEAAHMLGIGVTSLHQLVNAGKLRATKIGRRTVIAWSEIDRFIRHTAPAAHDRDANAWRAMQEADDALARLAQSLPDEARLQVFRLAGEAWNIFGEHAQPALAAEVRDAINATRG